MRAHPHPHDAEFMMNVFKVEPCCIPTPHMWKSCPFSHPGEPIRRRHPSCHAAGLCPDVQQGRMCSSGPERCTWAHNTFESYLHPAKFRTIMCRDGAACTRTICFFAHSREELRKPTSPSPASPRTPPAPSACTSTAASASAAHLAGLAGTGWPAMAAHQLQQAPGAGTNQPQPPGSVAGFYSSSGSGAVAVAVAAAAAAAKRGGVGAPAAAWAPGMPSSAAGGQLTLGRLAAPVGGSAAFAAAPMQPQLLMAVMGSSPAGGRSGWPTGASLASTAHEQAGLQPAAAAAMVDSLTHAQWQLLVQGQQPLRLSVDGVVSRHASPCMHADLPWGGAMPDGSSSSSSSGSSAHEAAWLAHDFGGCVSSSPLCDLPVAPCSPLFERLALSCRLLDL